MNKVPLHISPEEALLAEKVQSILAKAPAVIAPPFLAQRVLATHRERQSARGVRIWRYFAVAASACSLVLAILLLMPSHTFSAHINQPVAVRLEVKEISHEEVAQIEIQLPEGVAFYSEKYPELKTQRTLAMNWTPNGTDSLPFIIQADRAGVMAVKVRFYNGAHQVIQEKEIHIRFEGKA